jgi:hypothetical protein
MTILMIPADHEGNKLFLKELREDDGKTFVKYKSTYNTMPFVETEIYLTDGGKNYIITSDNGTVLWRFHKELLEQLK